MQYRMTEALEMYEKLIALRPTDADLHKERGVCLSHLNRLPEEFQTAFRLSGEGATLELYQLLGVTYRELNMHEEAVTVWKQALRVERRKEERIALQKQLAISMTDWGTILKQDFEAQGIERPTEIAGSYLELVMEKYTEALALDPTYAPTYYNIGVIFGELGQVERAQQYYEMALQYNSSLVEAHVNIGVIHKQRGELEAAIACYERALQLHPNFTLASMNLSVALNDYATSIKTESPSRFKEAVRLYKRALYHNSKYADAWYNLGVAYGESNRPERAAVCYEIAFHLNPQCAEALNNLGVLAKDKDNLERALQYYLQAVAINPRYPQPLNNMGVIYTIQGKLQEAKEVLLRAVELFNEYAEAWNNLGVLARDEGQMDLAHEYYARSLRYDPNARNTQHNLLMALNYLPDYPLQRMFEEHRDWGLRFQSLVTPLNEQDLPAAKDRDPERPLRVGYISPDFITHSVSYFIEAPLAYHRSGREVQAFCYSNAPREDQKSEHLRRLAHQWRQVHGKPASEVAAQIVADCIDILVELAGHTAGNRLDVCALCPAPLQITYLGYPNTSGLPTIHYRITDARADPPDTQQKFVEELIRLPDCAWCYTPYGEMPDVGPAPCFTNHYVTFACFNNLAKVNDRVLETWAKIMRRVPGSRIYFKSKAFSNNVVTSRLVSRLEQLGISPSRIECSPLIVSTYNHLQMYHKADLSLDTFPYTGTTTTCESLFMGVPCITLRGNTHAHNVGVSLLSAVGLQEMIANSLDEYVDTAVQLASEPQKLAELRAQLRSRMLASPLCDGQRFTRNLEAEYRRIWRRYCAGEKPSPSM